MTEVSDGVVQLYSLCSSMCDFGFENGTNIVFVWQVMSSSECTFGGATEGLDPDGLQHILETSLTWTKEAEREISAFKAVGLTPTPASIPTLLATEFKYKTRSAPMLRTLLERLMAQSVSGGKCALVVW